VFDGQAGLHQNYFRDYDPAIGRYVESDPIGLEGLSYSIYTYAGDNPNSYVDLFGLTRVRHASSHILTAWPIASANTTR
jgi:RHS repeat-associated protein